MEVEVPTADDIEMENGKEPVLEEHHTEDQPPPSVAEEKNSSPNNGEEIDMDNAGTPSNNEASPDENIEDSVPPQQSPQSVPKPWNKPFNGGPPPTRGRGGGGNSFFRGRGGGRFGGPNQDHNWQDNNSYNNTFNGPPIELWVETKSEDSKPYYYHAITRETTWTKPEGPNIKIMTQAEIEEMNLKNQQMQQQQQQNNAENNGNQDKNNRDENRKPPDNIVAESQRPDMKTLPPTQQHQPPPMQHPPQQLQHPPQQPHHLQPPPHMLPPQQHVQPPPQHQQPPPFFQGMHPPNFNPPPFGMPPPGYGHGGYQPPPWGMPWNMQQHHPMPQQEKPAKNLIIKPGVIDPTVIARAAEWSEHRAPDGRPYYYHAGRGESVWEKPQAIRDMEAARMAAHSGATPQTVAPPPMNPVHHILPTPHMHMGAPAPAPFDPSVAYNNAAKAVAADQSKLAELKESKEKAAAIAAEIEKKKKEEEKKTPAVVKPVDKSRPISSTPIAGTPWCVVWTGDGRVFFYNPSSRTSVWERPEDLLKREDVDKAVSNPPEQLKGIVKRDVEIPAETKLPAKPAPVIEISSNSGEAIKIRTESESSVEEVPLKKAKVSTDMKSVKKSPNESANDSAMEAEVRAAKERALVPLETRVKQFKEMLREKDVSAFSTWEKELHKIVFDPRYLLLTSKERKQVFEKYVKDRAEEERKEKRNKMRQKRDEFRKLMEEARLNGKSSFSEFSQRYGREDRYKAIEKVRERESLFNEYIVDVRRQEKEEKIQKKEQAMLRQPAAQYYPPSCWRASVISCALI